MTKQPHPIIDLLLLFAICFVSAIIFTIIATFTATPILDLEKGKALEYLMNLGPHSNVFFLKWLQIFQSIGLFVAPAFIFNAIWKKQNDQCYTFKNDVNPNFLLLLILTVITLLPVINITTLINEKMSFPPFLKGLENWMKEMENSAAALTEVLLSGKTITTLLINLLMIAVIPALGEELIFRGIVQNRLFKASKNIHVAILLTAFLFSAMHMQFYGFLPRFLLGVFFGYIYFWTKNIWYPIAAHFINNATAVILYYFTQGKGVYENVETVGTTLNTLVYLILSLGISIFFIQRLYALKTES